MDVEFLKQVGYGRDWNLADENSLVIEGFHDRRPVKRQCRVDAFRPLQNVDYFVMVEMDDVDLVGWESRKTEKLVSGFVPHVTIVAKNRPNIRYHSVADAGADFFNAGPEFVVQRDRCRRIEQDTDGVYDLLKTGGREVCRS